MRRKVNRSFRWVRWIAIDRNDSVLALITGCSGGMARIIARAKFPDLMYELTILPWRLATDRQMEVALQGVVFTKQDLVEEKDKPKNPPAPKVAAVAATAALPAPFAATPEQRVITTGRVRLWTGPTRGAGKGGAQ